MFHALLPIKRPSMNFVVHPVIAQLQPFPDESLLGFGLRIAEANWAPTGLRAIAMAIHTAKESRSDYLSLVSNIDALSQLTQIPVEDLQAMAFWHLPRDEWPASFNIGRHGGTVSTTSLYRGFSRICVECLKEQPYTRRLWDLKFYQACHIHHCKLISNCHGCSRSLSWHRPTLMRCKACHADIRGACSQAATQAEVNFAGFIAGCVKGSGSDSAQHVSIAPEFKDISIGDLVNVLGFLAGYAKDGCPIGVRGMVSSGNEELLENLRECEQLFADWPNALYRMIDANMHSSNDWLPPEKKFPHIYRAIARTHKSAYPLTRLRPLMVRYLAERHGSYAAQCGSRHGAIEEAARIAGYITLGEAARLQQTSVGLIKRAAPIVGVTIHHGDRMATARILKEDLKLLSEELWFSRRSRLPTGAYGDWDALPKVEPAECQASTKVRQSDPIIPRQPQPHRDVIRRERVDMKGIGLSLGVSPATAARLRRDSLFGAYNPNRPTTIADVLGYMDALERGCTPSEDPLLVPLMILAEKNSVYWRVGLRTALNLIKSGKLLVRGVDTRATGLNRILLSDADLRQLNDDCERG